MLDVNNGGGLWTTTGLIDTIIVELNEIECKGVENHSHIISCIQKLSSVRSAVEKLQNGRKEEVADDSEDEQGS